jgi:transcriptional regulator with XRE-family HTH domain
MDNRAEIRDFLGTRRAKVTPDRAGLVSYGPRRVAGLRRSEVAQLAAVSVEYYTRMERGNLAGVSDAVLESVSSALQLDEAEHAHLFHLARTANQSGRTRSRRASTPPISASAQRLLHGLPGFPAFIRNARLDVLAINDLGRALYSPLYEQAGPGRHPNSARFLFLPSPHPLSWPPPHFFLPIEANLPPPSAPARPHPAKSRSSLLNSAAAAAAGTSSPS